LHIGELKNIINTYRVPVDMCYAAPLVVFPQVLRRGNYNIITGVEFRLDTNRLRKKKEINRHAKLHKHVG